MCRNNPSAPLPASIAFRFVLIIGVANLFADMSYEGARSVTGPFLGTLGASAAVIGFTAGFGEFLGYALRSVRRRNVLQLLSLPIFIFAKQSGAK